MTTTNENTPAPVAAGNEGNESFAEHSPNNTTPLTQTIVNILFEFVLDTKFGDREAPIRADALTLQDVEQICARFRLPLEEVLEMTWREVRK